VLFGQDDLEEGQPQGLGRSATNLGIALLYDPLWLLGPIKGMASAGIMTQRGARIAEKIINPAQALFDVVGLGARGTARAAGAVSRRTLGIDKTEEIATTLANRFVSKYAGMPEDALTAIKGFESRVASWREQGSRIIRAAKQIGGRRAQELLGEAMELDAIYYARKGMDLTADQTRAFNSFRRKLEAEGISEHLFMQTYDNFRALDDTIGQELGRLGILSAKELAEYEGVHLRRVYAAFEHPEQYIDRMEALVERFPGGTRISKKVLQTEIQSIAPDIQRMAFKGASGDSMRSMAGLRKYIDQTTRVFHPERLVDDIDSLVRANANSPISDVMAKVKTDILGLQPGPLFNGVQGNNDAAALLSTVANHISGSLTQQKGAQHYVDLLRSRMNNTPMRWRTIKENLALIDERANIPQEIREALGEVMGASARMSREVGEMSGLMEFRRLADTLTDTVRISTDNLPDIERLRDAVKAKTMTLEEAVTTARKTVDPQITAELLMEGTEGSIIASRGTAGVSGVREMVQGAAVQLPKDERLGSLSEKWVKPAIARMVNNIADKTPQLQRESDRMASVLGNQYKTLVQRWKAAKVIWDPTAQARNIIGNLVLADFQGTVVLRPDLVRKSVGTMQSIATGNPNHYARLAAESGYDLFGGTLSKTELNRLGDEIGGISLDPKTSPTNLLTRVMEGTQRAGTWYHTNASGAFQFNEEFHKMSVFIDQFEKLKSPMVRRGIRITPQKEKMLAQQAAALAEEALFNYGDIPYAVEFLRDTGLVPFITFPFKATQYTAKTLYQHPSRVLKYHRIPREMNDWLSGGPDETAAEIDGLPRHLRDSLVLKLPFNDAEGRPLYIDFSYFMPYAVVKELAQTAQKVSGFLGLGGETLTSPTEFGLREGYFNPPIMALLDMFRRGEDTMGRPMLKPEQTFEQNMQAIGNTLAEFILPPSFPGGSRAETMGRSLQALSRTSPEPVAWMEVLAVGLRGMGPDMNEAFTYPGLRPTSGSAIGGSQGTQAINWAAGLFGSEGLETFGPGGTASVLGGLAETAFLGGATASDPRITTRQNMTAFNNQLSNVGREIAKVRSNPNLSRDEKVRRIQRLIELRQRVLEERGRR
jgi:hypothetical protein